MDSRRRHRDGATEQLLLEVLENRKRLFGDDHIATVITYHTLACIYRDTNRAGESNRLFEQVQRFCDEKLQPEHGLTIANLEEHAKLLRSIGDDAGATKLEARPKESRDR